MKSRKLFILETNVDDATPEALAYAIETIMGDGALDVHVIPCLMKKGRPGHLIRVLADDPKKFSKILMRETSTLGVRAIPVERFEVERTIKTVEISMSGNPEKIRIKESELGTKPEPDDIARLAKKYGLAYADVMKQVNKQLP
ncbi:MAG: hypothetical protein MSIBF_00440 [Candidatus Altiarchaeales archaeon IMC4]|nr:MAG: hypothetical protein MSIBF_00440 [Candidatus Altiarchaeales archaeon IMC4]